MSFDNFDSPSGEKCFSKVDGINPQVHVELEQLNCATDSINKLELELDESRAQFRSLLIESTQKIDALAKKLGTCVEKSRPYYEARITAKEALQRTHEAAVRYERASSHHQAARELVALAEEGLTTQGNVFDQSWQEMLNHSTEKVNAAEYERVESAKNHELCSHQFQTMQARVKRLQKQLKREIARSRMGVRRSLLAMNCLVNAQHLQLLPYFEMKAHFNQLLELQKARVSHLEAEVAAAKHTYSDALHRLESISDQIHQARGAEASGGAFSPLGVRGAGVGAESPDPRPCMPGCSSLPAMLGEDPLGLDDEFYPPPRRLNGAGSLLQSPWRGSTGSMRLTPARDADFSDTESLASVSTISSVEPLSEQQIGYIALDDELRDTGATCLVNHNFSLVPPDGSAPDSIDQAVARLSAVSLSESCEKESEERREEGAELPDSVDNSADGHLG